MASTPLAARLLPPISTSIQGRRRLFPVRSSSSLSSLPAPPLIPRQDHRGTTRRAASVSFLLLLVVGGFSTHLNRAYAANPFDKYVKRKKLDPLETYVPAVLLTQAQFKDLEESLDVEKPEYGISRSLLRSGPAASLRVNIRAVAQYATDDGKGKAASDAVDQCLRALEDLDSLLLHASRNDPTASIESMKRKIDIALGALDSGVELMCYGSPCSEAPDG
ncbi:uncharacterized protein LOC103712609 isoform X2 [Phoenix dactylifera]|uniref:Uncharacterized protein LOC103712609 isoform X2 n=1 Tax=Phoenix dactylifera TaxID=42345 RepID=A0A8B7CEF7_PHODC|nr:uncharacterized protein LOC103712609 isoform X2 [Phoenix dactylifera]